MKYPKLLLLGIIALAFFLRFYQVGTIPAGIHQDEESHGYNAFSLAQTGKDRYGQSFPILFRSFGSYQPPVYTYLATIPIGLWGNTVASVRIISVIAGTLLVWLTYLFVKEILNREQEGVALIAALLVAISPWAIYFSRLVAEGNLGVMFFVLALVFLFISLRKIGFFPLACLALGISTHAYYSERIIAVLFLPVFVYFFWNCFAKYKKWLFAGTLVFAATLVPHIFIATSGALTRRLVEVGYLGQKIFILEFIRRYLIYLSPKNLFFDLGENLGRMPPNLGVFYTVLLVPLFVGLTRLRSFLSPRFFRVILALMAIAPIPAALTGDSYYPLRALVLIWIFTVVIAIGSFVIIGALPKVVSPIVITLVLMHSLFSLYISYFVLFKYEMAKNYGNAYFSLLPRLEKFNDYTILIDSARNPGAGLRVAYLKGYDPLKLQGQLGAQMQSPYYSGDVAVYEEYQVDNMIFAPIIWENLPCTERLLIVGDYLSVSKEQATEHKLKFEFEVRDISGDNGLVAYSTQPPKNKCRKRTP